MRRVVTILLLVTIPETLALRCFILPHVSDDPDSGKKLLTCDESVKSCRSSYKKSYFEFISDEESLLLSCSDEPCMLDSKEVNFTVCTNTTHRHEECCCYEDECNENYRRQHFLDKGIPVHVPTTCKDFDTTSFKFGKLEYDKDPVGNFTDDNDVYDSSYNGAVSGEVKVINAYPNGTVARIVCNEGYGTYLDDYDDGLATNRVEKEVNTTCIDGGWTVDLDIYTRSSPETTYDFLMCEPHNADWKSSLKEDYFGVDHGAYGGSGDEGAEDDEYAADNSTEPRLKCYQGYEVAPLLLRDCKKGDKSCRSEDRTWEAGVLLTCSDEPCEFSGKVVDTAVCYNTSADWEERCCCYGDGCNENTLRGEYLAKGIDVKSPSSCVGFDATRFGFSHGQMVYSEELTGTVDFSEDYVDYSMYPIGTVARLICDKGYASYRGTGVYDKEKQEEVYEKYILTYTCDNGGWVEEGADRPWLPLPDFCLDDSVLNWLLVEPAKPAKEDDPPRKVTLADSVAQRIERFYDKAKHSEQVFLKRLFKHLATNMDN